MKTFNQGDFNWNSKSVQIIGSVRLMCPCNVCTKSSQVGDFILGSFPLCRYVSWFGSLYREGERRSSDECIHRQYLLLQNNLCQPQSGEGNYILGVQFLSYICLHILSDLLNYSLNFRICFLCVWEPITHHMLLLLGIT